MKTVLLLCLMSFLVLPTSSFADEADDKAYFLQFIAEEEVDDRDPENPIISSRYLMSDHQAMVDLPDGNRLNVVSSILLFADNRFAAVYKENFFPKDSNGSFYPRTCKIITGSWSVQDGKLMLPGYGHLERALFDGRSAVKMTVTEVIHSPEAKDIQAIASFGFSNMTLEQAGRCFPF